MKKQVHYGMFEIGPSEKRVPGMLVIDGEGSDLLLWNDEFFSVEGGAIRGVTSKAKNVTLFDCLDSIPASTSNRHTEGYEGHVTFHRAAIGNGRHLGQDEEAVVSAEFTFDEIASAFSDTMREFGMFSNPDKELLAELERKQPEWFRGKFADHPIITFFTGEHTILPKTKTSIGSVRINRNLSSMLSGLGMKERPSVRVDFDRRLTVKEAYDRVRMLRYFLGLLIGYVPTLTEVRAATGFLRDGKYPDYDLELHSPREYTIGRRSLARRRIGPDILASPSVNKEEFARVMACWFSRNEDSERRSANSQFLGSFNKQTFSVERHIVAASIFDRLPKSDRCFSCGKKIEKLQKIINHRAGPILAALGPQALPRLKDVIHYAVDCRNHYVHGTKAEMDYEGTHARTFLTQTLEFIFGVSALLDCEWDISSWQKRAQTDHPFAIYLYGYESQLQHYPSPATT